VILVITVLVDST